jgi:uncharacterized protein (TIGR02270 family)
MNYNAPLLNLRILRLHAENAAFVAALLRRGLDGPNFGLIDLYDLENRLAGHLDALTMAGQAGQTLAMENVAITAGYGELFTQFHVALRQNPAIALVDLVPADLLLWPEVEAFGAAASWVAPDQIAARMRAWVGSADPMAVWIALDVCGRRRVDLRERLAGVLAHPHPQVAARAMQLAGELGRADLAPALAARADSETVPELRFAAAWSAALLGDHKAAPAVLAGLIAPGTPAAIARQVAELLPLVCDSATAKRWIGGLLSNAATDRWGIVATGALGAAEALEFLIRQMQDPLLSRIAGASFCRIAGIRLGPLSLELATFPDDPANAVVEACPQESFIEGKLYWPDPDKLTHWLAGNRHRFAADTRNLLGAAAWTLQPPIENHAPWQLDQRALALEIATRSADAPLPNWRGAVVLLDRGFTRLW